MDAARVVVWHNPRCSNSRAVLQLLRDRGVEPDVVDYLAEPPDRAALLRVAGESGLGLRGLVREKEPAYAEQGLADADDEALLAAMLDNPRLINAWSSAITIFQGVPITCHFRSFYKGIVIRYSVCHIGLSEINCHVPPTMRTRSSIP